MKIFLVLLMTLTGCTSATKSSLVGTGIGITSAHAVRSAAGREDSAALETLLLLGLVGGVSGFFVNEELKDRDKRVERETLLRLNEFWEGHPNFSE